MINVYVCVDCGGSGTKIVYCTSAIEKPRYVLMSPHIESISKNKLENYFDYRGWVGSPLPEQQAWLEWKEQTFVVGAMAAKFEPEDRLFEVKYENALYKVMAAIGVIVEQQQIKIEKSLNVELAVLLPWNEYSDRHRFKKKLSTMLRSYKFRGQPIKVKLSRTIVRPEGGGLVCASILKNGLDWFRSGRIGVLMFGHRNLTALLFENGELISGDSPMIGFSYFLDRVIELTSGLDRERLASAICSGINAPDFPTYCVDREGGFGYTIYPRWEELDTIKALVNARDESLRAQELEDLVAALNEATNDYSQKINRWLTKSFTETVDEALVSGGAARFVEPELEQFFGCRPVVEQAKEYNPETFCNEWVYVKERTGEYVGVEGGHFTPITWDAGIASSLSETFNLFDAQSSSNLLSSRLVDAFGLFEYLIGKERVSDTRESTKTA